MNSNNSLDEPNQAAAVAATTTTTTETVNDTVFPCLEQPLRVTLHCNGHYLWGLRHNGRVIARPRRSAPKDEFRLKYNDNNDAVEIYNHKFGGALTVLALENDPKRFKVVCVKNEQTSSTTTEEEANQETALELTVNDNAPATSIRQAGTDENEEEDDEAFQDEPVNTCNITEEDRTWCFIRQAAPGGNKIMLKSLKTGHFLGIDKNTGTVVLMDIGDSAALAVGQEISTNWDIDCVTGELCFVSNPALDARLRCDMAGLLTLTNAWKGWEVFRFMEAGHGYVKISSWMHSQWLLGSTGDGTVTTCRHADSLVDHGDDPTAVCSQWAIEKSPQGEGVIIRSKTHGRLLSVHEGGLRTYSETDDDAEESSETGMPNATTKPSITTMDESTPQSTSIGSGGRQWWSSSIKSVNNSMRNMKHRLSSASLKSTSEEGDDQELPVIPQKDTLVWQLEAAHRQTYFFSSILEGQVPKTIGPFPQVTPNLRRTDKIQLQRKPGTDITLLYETEKKEYVACSVTGDISFLQNDQMPDTEWVMTKASHTQGGNVFRSKHHNLYLSYRDLQPDQAGTEIVVDNAADESVSESSKTTMEAQFTKLFGNKQEGLAQLVGSQVIGEREVWSLEPCMPRAVSSEKIKTFALGTSIALGTTILMPFALAGAGAVLGAFGAEAGVLFNVIAAGLTGAEALASVGAIGATAYIVFRPEDNSLTDDHSKEVAEEEKAWSKRPFSNWRNW